jgi:glutathione S-transferase
VAARQGVRRETHHGCRQSFVLAEEDRRIVEVVRLQSPVRRVHPNDRGLIGDAQMGGVGPMFGQLGFFHKFAGKDYEDKRPRDRYVAETRRLLGVLNDRLANNAWMMGNLYTIADIAIFPWVRTLVGFYEAADLVGLTDFPHVTRALGAFLARPAVIAGLEIPKRA